jgi:hypothetical protein
MPILTWAASTVFRRNQVIRVSAGDYYRCTIPGTTGATAPTWPNDGTAVIDGTITWSDLGPTLPVAREAQAAQDLEAGLASQAAAGTSGVTVSAFDGVESRTDPAQVRKNLLFFERRAARRSGRRPRVRTLDISRAMEPTC